MGCSSGSRVPRGAASCGVPFLSLNTYASRRCVILPFGLCERRDIGEAAAPAAPLAAAGHKRVASAAAGHSISHLALFPRV